MCLRRLFLRGLVIGSELDEFSCPPCHVFWVRFVLLSTVENYSKQIIFKRRKIMTILGTTEQTPASKNKSEVPGYLQDNLVNEVIVMEAGMGESRDVLGSTITFKLTTATTSNQLGIYEVTLAPGVSGPKLHYHRFMDETFVATQGKLTLQLIDRKVALAKGGIIHITRFTPHGFYNSTDEEIKVLMIFNPPQHRENFFRGMSEILAEKPIDAAKFFQLYDKYDSHPIAKSEAANILHR